VKGNHENTQSQFVNSQECSLLRTAESNAKSGEKGTRNANPRRQRMHIGQQIRNYVPSLPATLLNVELALLPIDVMAVKQTTTISDNITAYSTAVGPSSDFKKRSTLLAKFFMLSLQKLARPEIGQNEKLKT
jgi:hypothetical protein